METIKVSVEISKSVALAEGKTQYGATTVVPNEADLQALTPDSRAVLADYLDGGRKLTLPHATADWAGVLEAVNDILVRREAWVQGVLATPDEKWLEYNDIRIPYVAADYGDRNERDPRIHARLEALKPVAAKRQADRREQDIVEALAQGHRHTIRCFHHDPRAAAWLAQDDAREAAEKEKMAKRAEEYARICRDYVIAYVPEFSRAARDGKDMTARAAKHAEESLKERLGTIATYRGRQEHTSPPNHAYDVMDRVGEQLTSVELPGPIASTKLTIVRVDTCDEPDCKAGKRTCVEVELTWRDGDETVMYVLADPAGPHVHARGPDDEE
jgi:hypothetical protein